LGGRIVGRLMGLESSVSKQAGKQTRIQRRGAESAGISEKARIFGASRGCMSRQREANKFLLCDLCASVLLTLKIPSIREDFGQAASFVKVLELAFRAVMGAVTTMRPCVVRR